MRSSRLIICWSTALVMASSLLVAPEEARSGHASSQMAAPDTVLPPPDSIPYVRYIQTFPDVPVSDQPTIVAVVGEFPFPCGEVFLANARDPGHLVISIRPSASCPDSTSPVATWYEAFLLGILPPGLHHVELELTVVQDPAATPGADASVYRGVFDFRVVDPSTPVIVETWGAMKRRYR